jgi:hypothetical protein
MDIVKVDIGTEEILVVDGEPRFGANLLDGFPTDFLGLIILGYQTGRKNQPLRYKELEFGGHEDFKKWLEKTKGRV